MHTTPGFAHLQRRRLIMAGLGGLALGRAWGQSEFPTQPVRLVVPFGPGGFADVTTRAVGQKLSEGLGQQVVIDNRPGAGGVVAAQAVLSGPHDGHSMILFSNGTTIATTLLKLPYDPETDFAPVSTLAYFDLLLLTNAGGALRDVQSLLAEGKRRRLVLGSINPGSTQHLSAELFRSVSGVDAMVVPFKTSGEVQLGIQRGDVDVGFESYAALRGAIDGGALRAVACTGTSRTAWLPQVPTVKEAGVSGYDVTGWNALYVPKGVPAPVVEKLNRSLRDALSQPDLRKRFLEMGADPQPSTPAEMAAVFERDKKKWAQVIRNANIKIS
jgi:tripartite-type tricarboxylate transporter receptor subunit TctC